MTLLPMVFFLVFFLFLPLQWLSLAGGLAFLAAGAKPARAQGGLTQGSRSDAI